MAKPATRKEARPKFSREMALFWLDGIDEHSNDIASVAIAGLEYQDNRADDYKDEVICSLLRVIQQQADGSVKLGNELRAMLATLPVEANHV